MDSTLTWNYHIENLIKKISRSIGVLYKIRPFATDAIMKSLYYSIIHPHLIYAIQVWGSTFDKYISKLVILQKKAIRLITNNPSQYRPDGQRIHTKPLFYSQQILKVSELFEYQTLIFIYNTLNGNSPPALLSLFTRCSDVYSYSTRSCTEVNLEEKNAVTSDKLMIFIAPARLVNYGQKSIKMEGSKLWNAIPTKLKMSPSLSCFRNNTKQYLLSRFMV